MNTRIEQLQKLLANDPDDCFLNYAMALEFVKLNDVINATMLFEKLIERSPHYSATYYQFATLLAKTGKQQEAENIFRSGMMITKETDPHTHNELQNALQNLLLGLEDY